ncbi:MAG: hypothetical protein IPO08_21570 [Xanthomonadales bacterium]|nr:hypothetical protein [Xanthomonadales bacterium]
MVVRESLRPVLQQCYRFGGHVTGLRDDQGRLVDGVRLLWALAGIESDYGRLAEFARHEPAYMPRGRYYTQSIEQRQAWARWGITAACSFGAWQVMAATAREMGYDGPPHGLIDHETCCRVATALITRRFVIAHGVTTLRDVFDAYNSGNARDGVVPSAYITKGLAAYGLELPTL